MPNRHWVGSQIKHRTPSSRLGFQHSPNNSCCRNCNSAKVEKDIPNFLLRILRDLLKGEKFRMHNGWDPWETSIKVFFYTCDLQSAVDWSCKLHQSAHIEGDAVDLARMNVQSVIWNTEFWRWKKINHLNFKTQISNKCNQPVLVASIHCDIGRKVVDILGVLWELKKIDGYSSLRCPILKFEGK